jgi:hypothetical protein
VQLANGTLRRSLRAALRFLVVQNCFYLISGFLMLLGCLLMAHAPGADGPALAAGLKLLGVVLAYQAIVTGLAVHVRRRLHSENDAFNLGCISLVLLLDPTFFSTRFWGYSFGAGLAINGALGVVSAVMLAVLIRAGAFPISRRAAASWLAALGIVYLGGIGLEPTLPARNVVWLTALSFGPLLLAALARRWHEPESDVATADGRGASGAPIPVLWGDARSIYRRYMAAILLAYPFLVSIRHVFGLSGAFRVDLGLAHFAPALLGAGVLLVKVFPGLVRGRDGWPVAIGAGSLALAAAADGTVLPSLAGAPGAAPISMLTAMLVANVLYGWWMARLSGDHRFPWWAAVSSILAFAGGDVSTIERSLSVAAPAPLAAATGWCLWWAARDRGFWEIWRAAAMGLVLALRLAPLPAHHALPILVQGLGIAYLALVHAYPRKDLRHTCTWIAMLVLALPLGAAHAAATSQGAIEAVLIAELAAFWIAGVRTPVGGYKVVAMRVCGIHMAMRALELLSNVDVAGAARAWAGPAVVTMAFLTLLIGYRVTRRKEEILRWIDEAD